MRYRDGNLITLAKEGHFNIITHGCNCFCTMGSGIAPQIAEAFPEAYDADQKTVKGDIRKLGGFSEADCFDERGEFVVTVINSYTTECLLILFLLNLFKYFKLSLSVKVFFL